jgi:hypothetical protein
MRTINEIREVIFIHERGHEVLTIVPKHDELTISMMPGAAGLKLIERPVFKSKNGDWTIEEMQALSNIAVFKEKGKVRTRTGGSETFKDEGLAVYDTMGGMFYFGGSKEKELAKSIFGKMFPKLSITNVYSQLNTI